MPVNDLKSVLIVSQGHPPLGRYLADAFQSQGVVAIVFCTDQNTWFDKWVIHPVNKQLHNLRILPKGRSVWTNHPWAHRNYLETEFQKALEQHQPDLILAVRGSTYCERSIKESGVVKYGWWVEPANRVHEIERELPHFDWWYSMNEESLCVFREMCIDSCSYMPHMFSCSEFFPVQDQEKTVDLVFVGNWNPRRQRYIDAAMEVTSSIVLYGKDWLKRNWKNQRYWRAWKGRLIQGESLNRLYNSAKIVVNITQWDPGADGYASGMNMRFFEVPATQSLLMSDAVREAEELLTAEEDFVCFTSEEDFKNKICALLNDTALSTKIAESGYEKIKASQSSYIKFANDVVQRYANHLDKRNNSSF